MRPRRGAGAAACAASCSGRSGRIAPHLTTTHASTPPHHPRSRVPRLLQRQDDIAPTRGASTPPRQLLAPLAPEVGLGLGSGVIGVTGLGLGLGLQGYSYRVTGLGLAPLELA